MKIVGCDLHTRYQQIAMLDQETGELIERRLEHESGEARAFYAAQSGPVRVGIEATGHTRWFERMLTELGHELWIGDAAQIRASVVRKQKTDARDAAHLLELLLSERFPRIWRPDDGRVAQPFAICAKAGVVHSSQQILVVCPNLPRMPWGLKRYQQTRQLHFITFSCYHRAPFLGTPNARNTFIHSLERTRRWYGFYVAGYVVMPEHVHLLISEPERSSLHVALQMLKQIVSRKLRSKPAEHPFRQPRYYDFNVWSESKRVEKLDYIHNNPVKRGLVANPEEWEWSSFRHFITGEEGVVEIESWWTAKRREALGIHPTIRRVS